MTGDELRALLRRRRLPHLADRALALAAPTVRVYITPADEGDVATGTSKIGGLPDLPSSVEWPVWHEPMGFIAQFNLAQVAPYDVERALPGAGLLAFFFETDGEPLYSVQLETPSGADAQDYPEIHRRQGWRVLYLPGDPATFTRREPPPGLNPRANFPACAARFAAEVTVPDLEDLVDALGLDRGERNTLIDVLWDPSGSVNRGPWHEGGHHLLGHPYNLDGSTLALAAASIERAPNLSSRGAPLDGAAQRERERDAAARWRLLLQVDSSEQAQMDWAGGGLLHWCIERDALARADFSRVWLNMQFL